MPEKNVSVVRAEVFRRLTGLRDAKVSSEDGLRSERQLREYIGGITRQKRWLNYIIDSSYSGKRPLDDNVRAALQIGLYDLLFLATPDYAAIDDTVQLSKVLIGKKVTGVVNAVLRKIQREGVPSVDTGRPVEDLAIQYSHPDWMVKRWFERYGPASTKRLLEYNNQRPSYCVRINRIKTTPEEFREVSTSLSVTSTQSRYSPDFFYVDQLQPLIRSEYFKEGYFSVQDESAGLVIDVVDPSPGQVIIDLCAAPGGKTSYLVEKTGGKATVIAVDRSEIRLKQVDESIERLGLENVQTMVADGTDREALSALPRADIVLLDAPCTGLGVLSKRADLRWRRTESQLHQLITLQDDLMDSADHLLKPGGRLIYSTCTIEPEENRDRVDAFLARHADMEIEDASPFVRDAGLIEDGAYRTIPSEHNIDGAFASRLVKVP